MAAKDVARTIGTLMGGQTCRCCILIRLRMTDIAPNTMMVMDALLSPMPSRLQHLGVL